jgi:hypothetical protein
MSRRPLLASLLLALLAVPAAASARVPPKAAVVRLVACDEDARTAGFAAEMRALPGATRLQLRFILQVKETDGWERVPAPGFGAWASAAPGRSRWVYDKHLENLAPGAYRLSVRFRWRAADGAVVRTATRRSRACKVPDPRPDLAPLRIAVRPGADEETRAYVVTVVNHGLGAAGPFGVGLSVDGAPLEELEAGPLEPGERTRVTFSGPACAAGGRLVATVDASALLDEADEADDTLEVPCTGARAGPGAAAAGPYTS